MDSMNSYFVFYEVAKEKNITKASEKLFISQPAVSQTIKKLEEELGVKLFIRNKKGVELTKLGEEIFSKVEQAMLALKSVEQMADEENSLIKGNLVIGAGSNIARQILPQAISNFLTHYPNIQITQREGVQTEMIALLKKGEVDVVISQANPQITDVPFIPLLQHKYVFVKKKGVDTARFIKMSNGSFTHQLFDEFKKQLNFENKPDIVVSGYRMAIELVKLGIGMTLVPAYLIQHLITKGELEITYDEYTLPTITFGYYINPATLTTTTKTFVKYLKG